MNGRRRFLRDFLAFLCTGGAIGGILKFLPGTAQAKESVRTGKWYG